jgi:hypothetical protein
MVDPLAGRPGDQEGDSAGFEREDGPGFNGPEGERGEQQDGSGSTQDDRVRELRLGVLYDGRGFGLNGGSGGG